MDQSITAGQHPVMADGAKSARFVGFGRRFVAYCIDYLIMMIITIFLYIPLFFIFYRDGNDYALDIFYPMLLIAAWLIYYIVPMSSRWQATIGKRVMEIYVIRTDGKRIGPALALGRFLAYAISTFPLYIGFLMPLWMKEKQALHDIVCGTRVVRERL